MPTHAWRAKKGGGVSLTISCICNRKWNYNVDSYRKPSIIAKTNLGIRLKLNYLRGSRIWSERLFKT